MCWLLYSFFNICLDSTIVHWLRVCQNLSCNENAWLELIKIFHLRNPPPPNTTFPFRGENKGKFTWIYGIQFWSIYSIKLTKHHDQNINSTLSIYQTNQEYQMVSFENLDITEVILGSSNLTKWILVYSFSWISCGCVKNRFIKILKLFFFFLNIIRLEQSDMLAE